MEYKFKDQIKKARLEYGCSLTTLTKIFGLGANTLSSYEKGAKPHRSKRNLVSIMFRPYSLKSYLETVVPHLLDDKDVGKLHITVVGITDNLAAMVNKYRENLNETYFNE